MEQLEALFAFLDEIVPLDEEEGEVPRTRGRKRCVSCRVVCEAVGADDGV